MRIDQAYISKSVADFPFLERFNLTPYIDSSRPALFIGCYTVQDLEVIKQHNAKAVVLWCGQDSLDCILNGWYQSLRHCGHVTWLTNVHKALSPHLPIKLVLPILLGGTFTPSPLGNKIYAYCPESFPQYHRIDLIEQLIEYYPQYEFIIGRGRHNQKDWLDNGVGNHIYDECFIGLCLSGYAGGGQTAIQMGLKGRIVVSNVIDLPNTYPWESIRDIKQLIEAESGQVGMDLYTSNLSRLVESCVIQEPNWLEL